MNELTNKFHTKKSLGQHFLTSPIVPGWMCDAAEIAKQDKVLEIGPGTGVLTRELLLRGAEVIALEADDRAIVALRETFPEELASGQLTCHHTDVREFTPSELTGLTDHGFKLVSNIPYYLSGFLFRTFLESPIQPSVLVFLVQKEVAKRITVDVSRGEKESILSLSVKAFGEPKYVRTVSSGHFNPPPQVDSAIIAVQNINRNFFKDIRETDFFSVLHLAFGQKRKQLVGNLSQQFAREKVVHILSTLGLSATVRAEDVPLTVWPDLVIHLLSTQNQ